MRAHRWTPLLILPLLLGFGCFSTIAPDRDPDNTPGGSGDGVSWARGQVRQFKDVGDRPTVQGVAVEAVWFADGILVEEDNTLSGTNGNFAASSTHPNITHVRLRAFKCDYDPNDPAPRFTTCCDFGSPCACESAWDDSIMLKVVPGSTVQQTLTINCNHP